MKFREENFSFFEVIEFGEDISVFLYWLAFAFWLNLARIERICDNSEFISLEIQICHKKIFFF